MVLKIIRITLKLTVLFFFNISYTLTNVSFIKYKGKLRIFPCDFGNYEISPDARCRLIQLIYSIKNNVFFLFHKIFLENDHIIP